MPRPKLYKPEEIQQKWNEYIARCKSQVKYMASAGKRVELPDPEVPTIEEFADFLELDPETLLNYEKAEGYEEYFGTIKRIKSIIRGKKVHSLVNGRGNTTGLIFDLKVNYGMKETNVHEYKGFEPFKIEIVDEGERSLRQDKEE